MNNELFITKLVELMDTDVELKMETKLDDIDEWDSLSYIAFIAMLSDIGRSSVKPENVKNAKTIADLYELVKDK